MIWIKHLDIIGNNWFDDCVHYYVLVHTHEAIKKTLGIKYVYVGNCNFHVNIDDKLGTLGDFVKNY